MGKKQKRQQKMLRQQAILNLAKTEGRDLTAEEQAEFDGLQRDIETLTAEIEAEERQAAGQSTPPAEPQAGNSATDTQRAIEGERERQIELLEEGKKVIQETRRWDDAGGESYPMRSKEDARDYRYFPDPDLVPIVIDDVFLEKIRKKQPEFREDKMRRYKEEFDIPAYDIEIITGSKHMADVFEATVALGSHPKKVSNWLMGETLRLLKEKGLDPEDVSFSPENLAKLISLTDTKAVSGSVAKEVFEIMFEIGRASCRERV